MNILKRLFSILLSLAMLAASAPVSAQQYDFLPPAAQAGSKKDLWSALQVRARVRQNYMTVSALEQQYDSTASVSGEYLLVMFNDVSYINSLSLEEAETLAWLTQYADFRDDYLRKELQDFLTAQLTDYNEKAKDFALKSFYAAATASLAQGNASCLRDLMDWSLQQMEYTSQMGNSARYGWAAVLLNTFALQSGNWNESFRMRFERKLEKIISQFHWLQWQKTDYKIKGVKSDFLASTNQGVLISLFAQTNSFFSMKDDDGILKQMVSTGGFNAVGRAFQEEDPGRFSDDGEAFYLHSPTPGTDGNGNFVDSVNGRRHFALSYLVQALFVSYYLGDEQGSSARMQQFIRKYLMVNSEGEFTQYLYVPLQALRMARVLHDSSSLFGWEKEAKALQEELYGKLKKGYPWGVACTAVQGACEVAAEWMLVGKVLEGAFKLLGVGGRAVTKAAGKILAESLPLTTLMQLGLIQAKAHSKIVLTKAAIGAWLKSCGWKVGAVGAAGAALTSDTPLHRVPAR